MSELPVIPFGPADWYHTVRDQIQHEDSLIMQRIAWLTAAQSFLFTAYAITANASPQPRNPCLSNNKTSSSLLFQEWHAFPMS
ncbi:MAG TPA: hypothetical protein VE860_16950 [Chthoniobacterales bacterium]|jgi:hypothetical protein|nr:hypothetical protein [Chthoniobacterales bacterium]